MNTDLATQVPTLNFNNFGNASFIEQTLILPKKEDNYNKRKKKNARPTINKIGLKATGAVVAASPSPARWSA